MSELVAIQSNLAIPRPYYEEYDPTCVTNPYAQGAGSEFTGPAAFRIPIEIRLRICSQGEDPSSNEMCEQIRRLGHGVNLYVDRDDPYTMVTLESLPAERAKRAGQYLGWSVSGLARIPSLGIDRACLIATNIPGHRTGLHPFLPSRVEIFGAY
ncbi:MAG: hypothetical protein AAB834_06565 [Patescibacteria group bacterium]